MVDSARDPIRVEDEALITPRTTTVTVRWRPTPRVYDGRNSLLTFLEDRKILRAFQVHNEVTHAMISDHAEISLTPQSISIAFSNGRPEDSILGSVLEQTLEILKPRVTGFYARFQHLISLERFSSYKNAREAALSGIFGALADELSIMDSAILIDGSLGPSESTFQVEFGIVDKGEAAERLKHIGSRNSSEDEPNFSHVSWQGKSLPKIALYIDSRWHDHEEFPPELNSRWLLERLKIYETSGDRLAATLLSRVLLGQPQSRAGAQ